MGRRIMKLIVSHIGEERMICVSAPSGQRSRAGNEKPVISDAGQRNQEWGQLVKI